MSSTYDLELYQQISNNMYQLLNETDEFYETIEDLITKGKSRLILNLSHFEKLGFKISSATLQNPLLYFAACEEGYQRVYESVLNSKISVPENGIKHPPRLGIEDWLGMHTVTPRGLCARLVNKLVCVEGIVTRCMLSRPRLAKGVYVADESFFTISRENYGISDLRKDYQLFNRGVPKTDKNGNPMQLELGLSTFYDQQTVTLQEMPESAPTGQLPRSVEVVLENDLVDSVKPGDRVRIFGLYRSIVQRDGSKSSGISKALLIANNVKLLKQHLLTPDISPTDIQMIREIAARLDAFEILSQSIAPSICGHDLIKKGLMLQLLGGERKELEDGMNLRGDIHIILIGDPSCGKSQLLRFIMNLVPLSLSTTGRGSSGVGLTAAVTMDKDTHERRLEAGAMVLGDGGLVCIDEFDKMNSEDRVAIHEVMEQQRVSINKAGVQTSLQARTTILAAGNPVYGSFDPSISLKSQITFPDSLLSRFDLIFIIRDNQTAENDRLICSQVIRQLQQCDQYLRHQNNNQSESDEVWGVIQPTIETKKKQGDARYWEISCIPTSSVAKSSNTQKVLSVEFLQKYIYYTKTTRKSPVLSEAAVKSIAEFYANLRQSLAKSANAIPTTRTLEACVRLATAHAKLKLKTEIDEEDAAEAQALLLYSLTGTIPPGYTSTGMKIRDIPEVSFHKKNKTTDANLESEETNLIALPDADMDNNLSDDPSSIQEKQLLSTKRYKFLMKCIAQIHKKTSGEAIAPRDLFLEINESLSSKKFKWDQFVYGLEKLQSENKIMLIDEKVWFI